MTVLSALVATAGLLLDSPAVVVGSMVIAPQISAALTGTVGLVLDDRDMIRDGLSSLAIGLVVAIAAAFAFAWAVRFSGAVPSTIDVTAITQVQNRISPGLLALVVGVCAGAAGAFGLATAIPVSLVGVMIAVALIPAAVGIGLAWSHGSVALGAFVLVAVTAASILLAGLAVFWYLGYRPDGWSRGRLLPNLSRNRVGTLVVVLALGTVAVAGAGIVLGQHVGFENDVHDEVRTVLDDDEYARLELVPNRVQRWQRRERRNGGNRRRPAARGPAVPDARRLARDGARGANRPRDSGHRRIRRRCYDGGRRRRAVTVSGSHC